MSLSARWTQCATSLMRNRFDSTDRQTWATLGCGGRREASECANEQRRRVGVERGPVAGAQVSVAARITCASNNGTGVRITSSPRHDGSDDGRSDREG
jgi:hypothetical protein